MTRIKYFLLLLIVSTALFAEDILLDRIQAIVGDRPILHSEIKKGMDFIDTSPFYNEVQKDSLKENYVEQLINKQIMYSIAADDSIIIDSAAIMSEVISYIKNTVKSNFPDETSFNEFLKNSSITYDDMKDFYFEQRETAFIKQQILFKRGITINVTEQDIKAYYEENEDSFYIPVTMDLYHIAFVLQPDSSKLISVLQKVDALVQSLQGGEGFSSIAMQYSDDKKSADRGGQIPYTEYEKLSPEMATFIYTYRDADSLIYTQSRKGFHIMRIDSADEKGAAYKQILVSFDISREDTMRVKNKAESVRQNILSGSMTFEDAAQQYSDDYVTGINGGFIGNISLSNIQGDMKDYLEDMQNGDISLVLDADFGFEIFMVKNREGGRKSSYEDVKAFIRGYLEGKEIENKFKEIIEKEKKRMYIKRIDE